VIISMNMCCYNRCHGNSAKGFWASRNNIYECVTFHVLTATSMKMTVFWDIASCNVKRRSTSTRLHGVISQKAVILIYERVCCHCLPW
jgi:hypothetical protein